MEAPPLRASAPFSAALYASNNRMKNFLLTCLLFFPQLSLSQDIEWIKPEKINTFKGIVCDQAVTLITEYASEASDAFESKVTKVDPQVISWVSNKSNLGIISISSSYTCGNLGCSAILYSNGGKKCAIKEINSVQSFVPVGFSNNSIYIKSANGCTTWQFKNGAFIHAGIVAKC